MSRVISLIVVISLFICIGCVQATPAVVSGSRTGVSVGEINTEAGLKAINDGALVIDVRSEDEYRTGALKGALNIPHDEIANHLSELGENKHRPIVLYCRSGHRAGIAARTLSSLGYDHLVNAGGYKDVASLQ